ncbi:MAG: 3-keto-5-aminohexanoate cleavage protein [Porticoccaceae bacterium]|nr:3-keto-5-aminohexanoate cleavage protein [Porticoccaceae bacterium]
MAKIMIESAINGNAHKASNPNIAYSPADIANDAIATCKAGAALIHFHVREPETGKWMHDIPYYSEVFKSTRQACNPLMWPTFPITGDAQSRLSHFIELAKDTDTKPDLGAGDMASVNLFSYDQQKQEVTGGGGFVYQNPYDDIRYFLEVSRDLGLRPTLQIFDASGIRTALIFLEQGLLSEPLLLKFYFGGEELPFGLPPTLKSLEAYLDMLRGVRCNWFSACLGGDIFPLVPTTISLGGHIRLGLEDFAYTNDGQPNNVQLVQRAVAVIESMGHQVATPEDARAIIEV